MQTLEQNITHLDRLEAQSVHILREAYREFKSLVMLWSIGKDSTVLLWLTVVLIPLVILFWVLLGIAAIALPIVGGIKALDGVYFRYPVVGVAPA